MGWEVWIWGRRYGFGARGQNPGIIQSGAERFKSMA